MKEELKVFVWIGLYFSYIYAAWNLHFYLVGHAWNGHGFFDAVILAVFVNVIIPGVLSSGAASIFSGKEKG